MKTTRALALVSSIATFAAGFSAPASGQLTITPTFDQTTDGGFTLAQEAAVNAAIANITSSITTFHPDAVTIEFQNTTSGLASSLTDGADLAYSTYLADLKANPNKSALQIGALATMPAGPNTGINSATDVFLTASNLYALGETAMGAEVLAGQGGFNSVIDLNLSICNASRTTGLVPGNCDLQSVATHEIDEALGIGGNGSTLYQPGDNPPSSLPTDLGPLDLFRYSAPGVRSFTYSAASSAYFSINGGTTNLVYFNQQNGADGADFGDWGNPPGTADGNTPGQVQDAYGDPYELGDPTPANLGANEITAFQVEGYNVITAPEPASFALLGTAGGALLSFRRWRAV